MKTCEGCVELAREQFPKGRTAVRCMAPFESPWGNGRVLDIFPDDCVLESAIMRPKWCTKE